MKILVDENLPIRLTTTLSDLFPAVHHVDTLGLKSRPDSDVWRYEVSNNYVAILTADVDFQNRVFELGSPPKVIRIDRCDFSAREIVMLVRREALRIQEFLASDRPLLVLRR